MKKYPNLSLNYHQISSNTHLIYSSGKLLSSSYWYSLFLKEKMCTVITYCIVVLNSTDCFLEKHVMCTIIVMLNSDPWDRLVYPYLTHMSDSYNLFQIEYCVTFTAQR